MNYMSKRRDWDIPPESLKPPLWIDGVSEFSKNVPTHNDIWIIEEVFKGATGGFYVECGANNGAYGCTYLLEKNYEWSGILIEPIPVFYEQCVENRPRDTCINACLDSVEGETEFVEYEKYKGCSGIKKNFGKLRRYANQETDAHESFPIKTTTLAKVLDECKAPNVIDYFALDVERSELEILKAFPFDRYKFKAMSIEMGGSTFKELTNLIKDKGYIRVDNPFNRVLFEAYFIHKDFIKIDYKV
tara:strand:+ start:131 stop:865 length:735 start_codon:yes stop_codon:yes gene_type:complete